MPSSRSDTPVRGTGGLIKSLNRSRILECLQQDGPLSRVELAQRTGISLPAVSQLVAELERAQLVRAVGKGKSSGGRRPLLYEYNFQSAYVIGLDVGGTKLAGGLTDLEGNLLATATIPTFDAQANGRSMPVAERLKRLIDQLLEKAQVDPAKVMGVGVGVPGIPDKEKGTVRLAPGLLPDRTLPGAGWELDVASHIRRWFGWPVHLDNDVNAILRGERWKGVLQGVDHALCVTIGTGIGAGLLLGGDVYLGARGAAGEMGYSLIGALGPVVRAQGYGPLESFAAGPGIARRYVERLRAAGKTVSAAPGGDGKTRDTPEVTARAVAEAAEGGDPVALEIWRETAEMLGVALANAAALLDPEVIVLGGGVARAPERLLLEPVRRIVETLVPYPPKVVVSALGEQAGVLGAVAIALDARRSSISFMTAEVGV